MLPAVERVRCLLGVLLTRTMSAKLCRALHMTATGRHHLHLCTAGHPLILLATDIAKVRLEGRSTGQAMHALH